MSDFKVLSHRIILKNGVIKRLGYKNSGHELGITEKKLVRRDY